jgi:hypothetical protein
LRSTKTANAAKARFMPPRKRTEAAIVRNSGDCRADSGTRSLAAVFGVRLKYRKAAPNQRVFSTRTTVKAVAVVKGDSRRCCEVRLDG